MVAALRSRSLPNCVCAAVYRSDGRWTRAKVVAYDERGDTYDVELDNLQMKYMVEADYLQHIHARRQHPNRRVQRAQPYRPRPRRPPTRGRLFGRSRASAAG